MGVSFQWRPSAGSVEKLGVKFCTVGDSVLATSCATFLEVE